jgi:hypothetical protein
VARHSPSVVGEIPTEFSAPATLSVGEADPGEAHG